MQSGYSKSIAVEELLENIAAISNRKVPFIDDMPSQSLLLTKNKFICETKKGIFEQISQQGHSVPGSDCHLLEAAPHKQQIFCMG